MLEHFIFAAKAIAITYGIMVIITKDFTFLIKKEKPVKPMTLADELKMKFPLSWSDFTVWQFKNGSKFISSPSDFKAQEFEWQKSYFIRYFDSRKLYITTSHALYHEKYNGYVLEGITTPTAILFKPTCIGVDRQAIELECIKEAFRIHEEFLKLKGSK